MIRVAKIGQWLMEKKEKEKEKKTTCWPAALVADGLVAGKKNVMKISCPAHPSVSFFTAWNWNYRHLARWYDRNIHYPRPRVSWSRIGSRRYFIGLRNYWIESHGTTADVCLRVGNMLVGRDHHREVSKSAWPWQINRVVRSLGKGVKLFWDVPNLRPIRYTKCPPI